MSIDARVADPGLPGLDRRRFLAAALALTTGALTWQQTYADPPADSGNAEASSLLATLSAPNAAARIGKAYLAANPREASPDSLLRQLDQALMTQVGALPDTPETMLAALTKLLEAEYCDGPLVRADGWLLAPSEARLYALAALAAGTGDTQRR
mgnify:CR=1 FL=1|jgi:hypothetical protein